MDDIEHQQAVEETDQDLNGENLEAMENMDMDMEMEAMQDNMDD